MPTYATGHKRHPQKDHLQTLSARRNKQMLLGLAQVTPPSFFDAVAQGWVGPIKNQSNCGSCWDFSGIFVVESAYYKAGALPADGSGALSEQYILSCCRNGGCNGDDNVTVLQQAKATGVPQTADYGPYHGSATTCNFKQSMTLYKINNWGFCDNQQGEGVTPPDLIKAAMMMYGGIGCAIAADDSFMNLKPGEVFKGNSSSINHDVGVVGWDDSRGSVSVGTAPQGGKAKKTVFRGRNSWGEEYCDKGYFLIEEGANMYGTEAVYAEVNANAPPIDFYV